MLEMLADRGRRHAEHGRDLLVSEAPCRPGEDLGFPSREASLTPIRRDLTGERTFEDGDEMVLEDGEEILVALA